MTRLDVPAAFANQDVFPFGSVVFELGNGSATFSQRRLLSGENDSPAEIEAESAWVMDRLGPDVPLHFTAFHPDWKLTDRPPTPPQTLRDARWIAIMRASITSIPATFTIPRARLPTVTLAARCLLAAIGMTSRLGIFPLTAAVLNVARAATVCLKQMPAAGVLAVNR